MPRISYFYGIGIYLYYADHAPPHFHAVYAQFDAEIDIRTRAVLAGKVPSRALRLVQEWAERYEAELMDNWERARRKEPLRDLPPLD